MVLNIIPIGTITPRVVSAQLHANTPADALNADNLTGCLAPRDGLNEVTTHQKSGDLKTLFKLGSSWIAWDDVVDVVRSQVTLNRFYYTGDTNETGPRKSNAGLALFGSEATWPTYSEPLGITPPTNVLTVEELGTEDEDVDEAVISYVYTYVTDWEEESAPSEVSTVTTLPGGKYTALSNMAAITDDFIDKVRFYRVEAGESGSAEYMAIAVRPGTLGGTPVYDLPASSITGTSYKVYDANHASTPTGLSTAGTDICPSEEWAAPPEELTNLTQYLNGVMIGSVSNVLYMSEPMIPYAWPDAYQQKFEQTIVALGVVGSTIVVLTNAYPYVVDGTDPGYVMKKRIEENQKCVAKRSVASTPLGVIYASPSGLFMVTGATLLNITEGIYTPAQWAALGPEDLIGFYFDNKYVAFFDGTTDGFIISLEGGGVALHPFEVETEISGGYVDPSQNELILIGAYGNDEGYARYEWAQGTALTYSWTSKTFQSHPTNYAVIQIKGPFDDGAVTVTVTTDGVAGTPFTVDSEEFKWLPSGTLYRSISIKVEGTSKIEQILLAHSPEELVDGSIS